MWSKNVFEYKIKMADMEYSQDMGGKCKLKVFAWNSSTTMYFGYTCD